MSPSPDLNSATSVARSKAKSRKRKTMKERIASAIERSEMTLSTRTREVILLPTGQVCFSFPWQSAAPQPWPSNCSRILVPLATPNRKGHRATTMIVRNEKLKFGGNGKAA